MDKTVDAATMLTESLTSLPNLAENIVVVAAVGAEDAITQATTTVLSIPAKDIITAVVTGITRSLNPIHM